ncbi:sigma-54 dependent transcriptional regulator [Hyphococcus flavus]|uniref:Sigma-54 dependent transcriptional regulator n=1 Tax=Hyphococcus flavus TaxID=1866326 RepID=A0AAF0CFK3_9PROT|nr:sigma-54 dependent transcriptional regulator [Hyphococcus flavus]WDI31499.1 sigma-54 dependent transcriptional regulator [Hyphococcus flavus]
MDDNDHDGQGRNSTFDSEFPNAGFSHSVYSPSGNGYSDAPGSGARQSSFINLKKVSSERKNRNTARRPEPGPIIGSSAAAEKLRETIALYADNDAPVLITGETGVGKELVARHLHTQSRRGSDPFSPLNAGAVPETLAASELFGHSRGAFTGAIAEREGAISLANGGVLFLDEIGEMPLSIQTHLLRVLEDGLVTKVGGKSATKTDFRLISATNVPLSQHVQEKKFRRDLYYRINVLSIDVPPLRARAHDAAEIAESFVASYAKAQDRKITLSPKASDKLLTHAYPGNVRELRNVLARAVVHAIDGKILPEHIVFDHDCSSATVENTVFDIDDAKNLVSRFVMMRALHISDGNVTKAAALTGRSRGTFHTLKKSIKGDDFDAAYHQVCIDVKALIDGC